MRGSEGGEAHFPMKVGEEKLCRKDEPCHTGRQGGRLKGVEHRKPHERKSTPKFQYITQEGVVDFGEPQGIF